MNTTEIYNRTKEALLRGEDIGRVLFLDFAQAGFIISPIEEEDTGLFETAQGRVALLATAARGLARTVPGDRILRICLVQRGGATKVAPGQRLPRSGADPRRKEILKMTMLDREEQRYAIYCPEIVRNAKGKVTALIKDLRPVTLLQDDALEAVVFGYEHAALDETQWSACLASHCRYIDSFGEAWGLMSMK